MLSSTLKTLEAHFRDLSRERETHGYPVYAFEHGLENTEIDAIKDALRAELSQSRCLNHQHWLHWTVVAAEVGYTYDGDEYWHSFEAEFSDWARYGDRDTVREWFKLFARKFSGFQPTGRWAKHFSIIAWPITHSILPRYLQAHFASHIYDLSHELASSDSLEHIGALLERKYYGGSSRFENFLEQSALTARLVLALRDEDVQGATSPIYRPTLARIIRDLERKGSSRGHLHDARRILRDARFRVGLKGSGGSPRGDANPSSEADAFLTGLKLVARPHQDDAWKLGIAFPKLTSVINQPGIAAVLKKTRMMFVDKPNSWMPGQALLTYSGAERSLSCFPTPFETPIVQFKDAPTELAALTAKFSIQSSPPWLLRVHEDGAAREVFGKHIRTDECYLIATLTPVETEIEDALKLIPTSCLTTGIVLYRLFTARTVGPEFLKALVDLGLGYSLRAHVKPIGLVPRWDSGLGISVWLPSEEILLQLRADFEVTEFSVDINSRQKVRIAAQDRRECIVSLGLLPIGKYRVEIGATPNKNKQNSNTHLPVMPETMFFEVRAPTPWIQGVQQQAGIRLILEPPDASLDDLIEKKATLAVHGPTDRTARVVVQLYGLTGHLFESSEIGKIKLPTTDAPMAELVKQLSIDPLSEQLESSPRIDLAVIADELGAVTATFLHKVPPLRWKLTHQEQKPLVRLVDEAGVKDKIVAKRYDMQLPDKDHLLDAGACIQGIAVDPPGSLFVAKYDGRHYSAFVSVLPREGLHAFTDLGVSIGLFKPGASAPDIKRLLRILRVWRVGRALGRLAAIRKGQVLAVIEQQIETLACGSAWAEKTQKYRNSVIERIEELQTSVGGSPGFASRMRTTEWTWHSDKSLVRTEFLRLAKIYQVSDDVALCNFALRLAFHPTTIRMKEPSDTEAALEKLGANGILARGAFFAKLTSDLRYRGIVPQVGDDA